MPWKTLLRRLLLQRLSWPVHLAFVYAGIVLPVICHLMTLDGPPDGPSWQSGALDDQLAFTLSYSCGFAFYPLMLYSIVSLTLLLAQEQRFAQSFVVRFGIYSGVPVALWYSIMLGLAFTNVSNLISMQWYRVLLMTAFALAPPLALWGLMRVCLWVWKRMRIHWSFLILLMLVVYVAVSECFLLARGDVHMAVIWPLSVVGLAAFFSLLFAPHWCLGVYLAMSIRLLWLYPQPPRFSLARLLAVVSWAAAFLGACRWAVVRSLEEYAKLPLENPGDCYIATAAAHGHPAIVRSSQVVGPSASERRVNQQLRVLKAGELALRVLAPRVHQVLRRIYDALGPRLARSLANPYLADIAYLSLKPAEWLTYGVLRFLLLIEAQHIRRLFR